MTRSFDPVDAYFTDPQLETLFHRDMGKRCPSLIADVDGGAGSRCQLFVAGDKIGMQVGLEDVPDADVLLLRRFQVDFDITLRIDYDRFAVRCEHVGGVGQTSQVELFEVHGFSARSIITFGPRRFTPPWPQKSRDSTPGSSPVLMGRLVLLSHLAGTNIVLANLVQ